MREFKLAGDALCVDRGAADVAYLLVRVHVWSVDHGREKPAEYWFPGPVSSAL